MKGQPTPPVGYDELYDASVAATYDRLVEWVINEWGESNRATMGAFLGQWWATRPAAVRSVLEICCGTGLMLQELVSRGYEVSGLDRSAAMLAQARARFGPSVPLTLAELPDLPVDRTFDAVICAAAALNYMATDTDLAATFQAVAGVLGGGGSFVFDVLSRRMILERFGTSTWAADLGDLAFIWKYQHQAGDEYTDLDYVQFVQRAGAERNTYVAAREMHRLYVLDHALIRKLAEAAGFADIQVTDNYSSRPVSEETLYETWTMIRVG
jgi:SAM-dependent methyltransferase